MKQLGDKCIVCLKQSTPATSLPYEAAMIRRTCLRRFIYHSQPEILRVLRIVSKIETLKEAYTRALEEESAQKIYEVAYKERHRPKLFCTKCHMNNHTWKTCRRKSNNAQQFNNNKNNGTSNNYNKTNNRECAQKRTPPTKVDPWLCCSVRL